MEFSKQKAGLLTLLTFIFFLVLIGVLGKLKYSFSGFSVLLKFSFLTGLQPGTPVLMAGGIKVGSVEEIYQKNLQTYVRVYLDKSLKNKIPLKPAPVFAVFSTSLMGQKYINLSFKPRVAEIYLQEGDSIRGIDAMSMDSMLNSFSAFFSESTALDAVKKIFQLERKLNKTFKTMEQENKKDINAISQIISKSFHKIRGQVTMLEKGLSTLIYQNPDHLKVALDYLDNTVSLLEALEKSIKTGQGSIARLINDKSLKKNTTITTEYAKEFARCIKNQPWVLVNKQKCRKF